MVSDYFRDSLPTLTDAALVGKIAAIKTIERASRCRDRDDCTDQLQALWCECLRRGSELWPTVELAEQAATVLFNRGLDVVRKAEKVRREVNAEASKVKEHA